MEVQLRSKFGKTDSRPIHATQYPAGPKARKLENQEINIILAMDAIHHAQMEWASAIVTVHRKDETICSCVAYHKLNSVRILDSYQIPREDECIDLLGHGNIFSKLDSDSSNWQVEISREYRQQTAFAFLHGLSLFTRMHFELENAPWTFSRAMDLLLSSLKRLFAFVHLNDIVIFLRTPGKHSYHVSQVFTQLYYAGVLLNPRTGDILTILIDYLGHVIPLRALNFDMNN